MTDAVDHLLSWVLGLISGLGFAGILLTGDPVLIAVGVLLVIVVAGVLVVEPDE